VEEAEAVVDYIYTACRVEDPTVPSVGIATFNINQRNLIWDMLMQATYGGDEASVQNALLLDRLLEQGLFVKNLENIQGDERDIVLISTTFGPDGQGRFRQQFGPVTQQKGYQLLNVIISRAKNKVAVFTSVPAPARALFRDALADTGNTGKGIFYAYLEYARSVAMSARGDHAGILDQLAHHCPERPYLHEQRSLPLFNQLIYKALLDKYDKNAVAHNHRLGGFILELALLRNGIPVASISTSCIARPRTESYRMFIFKKQILGSLGIASYFIDALNWYRDPAAARQQLYGFLDDLR
jgi:hypothetical protein